MAQRNRPTLSLGTQVVLAFVLGLAAGIFFGEQVAFMQDIGKAFILLLQMTVLPYITLSLITGLGQLTYRDVKQLILKAGAVLLFSWALAIVVILAMPLAFPAWESASFFSTSLVEPPEEVNYLQLFIPANPFYSFANNVVPAVVVFSIALGIALIGVEGKESLLHHLRLLNRAMGFITQFVAKLMPIGVFAIVANAAGTMSLDDVGRLQVYLLTYAMLALLLTLWILPAMVTSLTPLTYGQVVGRTRDILITAFATGSAFVVLPLIIERCKELLRENALGTDETEATVEVIVPAFTSFPKVGTLLPMSFVLFAGWFSGSTVPVSEYPTFVMTGLVSFFGSVHVAMPMLMDLMRVPSDLYQLYLAITVVTGRFAVLAATANIVVLTLLGACAVTGFLTPRWGRIVRNSIISVILLMVTLVALRTFFTMALSNPFDKEATLASMHLRRHTHSATVHRSMPPLPPAADPSTSLLDQIRARGILRVGYMADNLPFAFFNAADELVGFDVEMAYTLAQELGVELEFVPVDRARLADQLNAGACDVIMSSVVVTPQRAQHMAFTQPYMNQTLAFLVKDHRREAFSHRTSVRRLEAPRIGVLDVPYYTDKLQRYLPQAEMVVMTSVKAFLEDPHDNVDAFLFTAEAGSAWSLLYPAFTVAIPQPDVLTGPVAYAVAREHREFAEFLNIWIELKKQDRTIQNLYDDWILGKNAAQQGPRWSVMRNVLHWVE